ncbi:hypothetical protein GCM10010420_51530 [Streptomyces glaucosporus]|uniref:Integral membrane protein n=1 Tax=Streptomyces glaucosporus TaxID=284044 RepID=A0ABN3IX65_9ACTN
MLRRRNLSPLRLVLLWILAADAVLSCMLWTAFAKNLSGSSASPVEYALAAVLLLLAAVTLAAAAIGLTAWLRRGRDLRWLMADWATVDGEPAAYALPPGAAPPDEPAATGGGRWWAWLLASALACLAGLALLGAVAPALGPDTDPYDLAASAGVIVPLLGAGALGLATCAYHRRALGGTAD